MGIFSGNTTSIGKYNEMEIPFIEGYSNSETSFLNIIAETAKAEADIFDESMLSDFNELALTFKKEELEEKGMFAEAASIEIVTENAKDVWEKIKKLVMVVASKVKSAYEAVKVRITAFLTKDYYKFYSKHVDRFTNYAKNTKGKYSFRKPNKSIKTVLPFKKQRTDSIVSDTMREKEDALEKDLNEIKDGKYKESLFQEIISGTSEKTFKSDLEKDYFSEKEDTDHVTEDMIKEIKSVLGTKDMIKAVEEAQKQNMEYFKKIISDVDSAKKLVSDRLSNYDPEKSGEEYVKTRKHTDDALKMTGNYNGNPENFNVGNKSYTTQNETDGLNSKKLNVIFKKLSVAQTVNNTVNSIYIGLVKMHIAQCKAVFNKVVARSQFTEQTLLDAIEEVAMNETMEYLNM